MKQTIYILSDSLGETAEYVCRAAVCQFAGANVEYRRIPYVNDRDYLYEVMDKMEPQNSILVYTLVLDDIRQSLEDYAAQKGIMTVDILGPMMGALKSMSGQVPSATPGKAHVMDDSYFKKIEAVEFAVKYDDGKDVRGITYADIVIMGVSRTSKTPLCMYLAHKGLKVANVPLVPEVKAPDELFSLPRGKAVGLTVKPQVLHEIRTERLKTIGIGNKADYASFERILEELEYAEGIMKKVGCPIIDISHKAVEETASKVLQIYYRGDNIL